MIHALTRSQPPAWTGYARRVDRQMLAEVAWPWRDGPLAYVCGPTSFVESVAGAWSGWATRRGGSDRAVRRDGSLRMEALTARSRTARSRTAAVRTARSRTARFWTVMRSAGC